MIILEKARQRLTRKPSKTSSNASKSSPRDSSEGVDGVPLQPTGLATFAQQCRDVLCSVNELHNGLSSLQNLQRRALYAPTDDHTGREMEALDTSIMAQHKVLSAELASMRSQPHASSAPYTAHLRLAEEALRKEIGQYLNTKREYLTSLRSTMERQYRIIRPDASDEEITAACSDGAASQQMFAQAFMSGDRISASRSALGAVRDRHDEIERVARQLAELNELFELMGDSVIRQDAYVKAAEEHAETVKENMDFVTVDLGKAVDSAKKTRRSKWTCFWISVVIVVLVVAAIVIVVAILG